MQTSTPLSQLVTCSKNKEGGSYRKGKCFNDEKWLTIIDTYQNIMTQHGSCGLRQLARSCSISTTSAKKAIAFFNSESIERKKRGHGRTGIGSLIGLTPCHHDFLYNLYTSRPSLPIEGYICEFDKKFQIVLSRSFITRWFHEIGPYKGTFRTTSKFPPAKNSKRVYDLV